MRLRLPVLVQAGTVTSSLQQGFWLIGSEPCFLNEIFKKITPTTKKLSTGVLKIDRCPKPWQILPMAIMSKLWH
jgi:hypothetical protein